MATVLWSQSCHQPKPSPTSVANIDVAVRFEPDFKIWQFSSRIFAVRIFAVRIFAVRVFAVRVFRCPSFCFFWNTNTKFDFQSELRGQRQKNPDTLVLSLFGRPIFFIRILDRAVWTISKIGRGQDPDSAVRLTLSSLFGVERTTWIDSSKFSNSSKLISSQFIGSGIGDWQC